MRDIDTARLLSTTDARVWAEEFCGRFAVVSRGSEYDPDDDLGLMIGWFANAIEMGRDNTTAFQYVYGEIEFEFLPYYGWQEDVRVAASFLLRERPYAAVAKRLLAAFSPPAVKP